MTVLTQNERNWWLERLDAALDGDLPAAERERFMDMAALDPLLADEWALAEAMRRALASEHVPACPARVDAAIEAHVRASFQRERGGRGVRADRAPKRTLRPAALWSSVAAVIVLTIVAVVMIQPAPETNFPAGAPTASVDRAMQDVQWALAFVSDVGGAAGHSVGLGGGENQ